MKNTGSLSNQRDLLFSVVILFLSFGFAYYGCFDSMGETPFRLFRFGEDKFAYAGSFFCQVVLLLLLFAVLKIRAEKNYLNFTFQWKDLRDSVFLFLGGYMTVFFIAIVSLLILAYSVHDFSLLQPTGALKSAVDFLSGLPFWAAVVFLMVNAIFEESIVRALFMNVLSKYVPQGYLIVGVSALIQAGYHLYQGWLRSLLVFFLFLIFAGYYLKYRRTTPLILAHFLVDFSSYGLLKVFKGEL